MKKYIITLLFGLLSLIIFLGTGKDHAAAVDNEFVVRVEQVTGDQVNDFNQALANQYGSNGFETVVAGDYRVIVKLNNNTGYAESAVRVYIDTNNFRPVRLNGDPTFMNIIYDAAAFGLVSGGEKQIIACAGINVLSPEIVVLDEPSSNLDSEAIERLRALADRMLVLENGRVTRSLSAGELQALTAGDTERMGIRPLVRPSMIM